MPTTLEAARQAARDWGYAALGAGDVAAEAARSVSERTSETLPVQVGQLRTLREKTPRVLRRRYQELVARGRKVAFKDIGSASITIEAATKNAKPKRQAS